MGPFLKPTGNSHKKGNASEAEASMLPWSQQGKMQQSVKGLREKLYVYAPLFTGHWGNAKKPGHPRVRSPAPPSKQHAPGKSHADQWSQNSLCLSWQSLLICAPNSVTSDKICDWLFWQDDMRWWCFRVPTVGPTIAIPSEFFLVWKSSLQILSTRIIQRLKLEKIPMRKL